MSRRSRPASWSFPADGAERHSWLPWASASTISPRRGFSTSPRGGRSLSETPRISHSGSRPAVHTIPRCPPASWSLGCSARSLRRSVCRHTTAVRRTRIWRSISLTMTSSSRCTDSRPVSETASSGLTTISCCTISSAGRPTGLLTGFQDISSLTTAYPTT